MFCQTCGREVAPEARFCENCGAATSPAEEPATHYDLGASQPLQPGYGSPVNIPNYLVQAILVTIFCCLPAGVVAIVFAAQVNGKVARGQPARSSQALQERQDLVLGLLRSGPGLRHHLRQHHNCQHGLWLPHGLTHMLETINNRGWTSPHLPLWTLAVSAAGPGHAALPCAPLRPQPRGRGPLPRLPLLLPYRAALPRLRHSPGPAPASERQRHSGPWL